jgi:hypothetical protein
MEPWPPALLKRERKEERKGEKFYIYSDVTHTLAQKQLIELLMWNASHVQKHFS